MLLKEATSFMGEFFRVERKELTRVVDEETPYGETISDRLRFFLVGESTSGTSC